MLPLSLQYHLHTTNTQTHTHTHTLTSDTVLYICLSLCRITDPHHHQHQMGRTRSQTAALMRQPLLPSVTSTSAPVRGSVGGKTSAHLQAPSHAPILPSPSTHIPAKHGGIPPYVGSSSHRVPVVPALTSLTRPPLHHVHTHPHTHALRT